MRKNVKPVTCSGSPALVGAVESVSAQVVQLHRLFKSPDTTAPEGQPCSSPSLALSSIALFKRRISPTRHCNTRRFFFPLLRLNAPCSHLGSNRGLISARKFKGEFRLESNMVGRDSCGRAPTNHTRFCYLGRWCRKVLCIPGRGCSSACIWKCITSEICACFSL